MLYRKFTPSSHLINLVECYFVWESLDTLPEPLRVESPPSGFTSMVFNYGDTYQVGNGKHDSFRAPAAFLTGQATHNYTLHLSGRISMVGIVFKPTGLSALFGLPMYEFTDERIDLIDAIGKPLMNLQEQVVEARNPVERVQLLEQFLLRQLMKKNPAFERTDYAANLIVGQKGIVNVGELMSDLYVCRRQFERQFLQKVGISPKYYARIRRVGHLCAQLASQRWQVSDWHELIYQSGYYDQSHFIREFTQFTGKRPSLYVKDNVELTRYLNG